MGAKKKVAIFFYAIQTMRRNTSRCKCGTITSSTLGAMLLIILSNLWLLSSVECMSVPVVRSRAFILAGMKCQKALGKSRQHVSNLWLGQTPRYRAAADWNFIFWIELRRFSNAVPSSQLVGKIVCY